MRGKLFGNLLFCRRKQLRLTAQKVCSGICSTSTYSHYENNEITPDIFTLSALFERMGCDINHIDIICSQNDFLLSSLRNQIQQFLCVGDLQGVNRVVRQYESISKAHSSRLHQQYLSLIRGREAESQNKKEEASKLYSEGLSLTDVNIHNLDMNILLSCQEFEIIYRYVSCVYDSVVCFKNIYTYLVNMDENAPLKKRFFAICAYRIAELYIREKNLDNALFFIENGISYQKQIRQLKNIDIGLALKISIELDQKHNIADIDTNILSDALLVKRLFNKFLYTVDDGIIKYSKSKLIKYHRQIHGVTQEKLSEGICDVSTLRRYENGYKDPKEEVFFTVLRKLGINYINENEDNTFLRAKEVNIRMLLRCLEHSIPSFDGFHIPDSIILSENDMALLNRLAESYCSYGDMNSADKILSQLVDYLDNDFIDNAADIKFKTYANYSDILYQMHKYNESISISAKGLQIVCSEPIQTSLYNLIFNIGRCICNKSILCQKLNRFNKGLSIVNAAIDMCRYFGEPNDSLCKMIKMRNELSSYLMTNG